MAAFIYGVILAFGLIIPLGMQNVFIFNQGVSQKKWRHAIPSVLTAFICDALLITSAVTGVSLIVFSLPMVRNIIYILGIIFLIYMGVSVWKNSESSQLSVAPLTSSKQMLFAISVSLLNPHAIIDSVAVIGANSLNFPGVEKWFFTSACLLVSLLWFTSLSLIGHCCKSMDSNGQLLPRLNKISAVTIWLAASYLIYQFVIGQLTR